MILDVTYFLNLSNFAWDLGRDLNMVDPRIAYQYKAATNVQVANPFYNILPVEKFPGPLRSQKTVSATSLMKPYPQYGSISVTEGQPGGDMHGTSRFNSKRRRTSAGATPCCSATTTTGRPTSASSTASRQYLQQYSAIPSDASRHRLTFAATWEVPFGKGRQYMGSAPRIMDAVLGGWNITPTGFWRSGRYIRFGALAVNGDPHVDNPNQTQWFNTEGVFDPSGLHRPHQSVAVRRPDRSAAVQHGRLARQELPRSSSGSGSSCAWTSSTS